MTDIIELKGFEDDVSEKSKLFWVIKFRERLTYYWDVS